MATVPENVKTELIEAARELARVKAALVRAEGRVARAIETFDAFAEG